MSLLQSSILEDFLKKHNLQPVEERLRSFLSDIDQLLTSLKESEARNENLLKISYEEMQQWWGVINQRESVIKAILDSSGDIILTLDKRFQIEEFNHVAEELFKVSRYDVQGKSFLNYFEDGALKTELFNFVSNESLATSVNMKSAVLKLTPMPASPSNSAADSDAPQNWNEKIVDVKISAIRTEGSATFAVYMKDLTDQLAAQAELEKSREQALQAAKMASLGEMAGGVAHEINTPLNSIVMCSEMLNDMAAEENLDRVGIVETANTILATAMRISEIVSGLRKVSRDDSSDDMIIVSANRLVSDTLALCQQRLREHGITLSLNLPKSNPFIKCRSASISQVILNLLNNAHDALDGSANKWIKLDLEVLDDELRIRVTDSGNGIPESVLKKLMTPFFTTKPIGKGTGLGLSISKGIIEAHSGTLMYNPESPNTQFVITLPIEKCQEMELK